MTHKKLVIAGLLLVISAASIGLWVNTDRQGIQKPTTAVDFYDESAGVQLSYDTDTTQVVALTDQDKADKVILSLTDKGPEAVDFLVTVRYETGLAVAATLSKKPLIDYLEGAAGMTLAKKPGYELVNLARTTIADKDAVTYLLTYEPSKGISAKQELVIIPLSSDKAVYISFQSRVADFEKVSDAIFDKLLGSLKLIP